MKTTIQLNDKTITLIETAHVSKQSVLEVTQTIESLNPDCICIELDDTRAQAILHPADFSQTKLSDVIRKKQVTLVAISYILSQYQKKMAQDLDISVGDEMKAGLLASQQRNIPHVNIDRSVKTTFKRIFHSLTFFEKIKLLNLFLNSIFDSEEETLTAEDIEALKEKDILEDALVQLGGNLPTVSKILVDERDQFMAEKIKQAPGHTIVAIIGAAHSHGIQNYLNSTVSISLETLNQVPKPSLLSKGLKWFFALGILVLITLSVGANLDGLLHLSKVMLIASGASAIGALLCLAHPITILVAFLATPISILSPVLTVGWFTGLSEAYFRSPKVKDFETLNHDVKSIKTLYKNNILRALLIMFITSLCASLVTITFSIDAIKNLFL